MEEEIDVIFLLDRSGSMYGAENDTIGGFNAYIEKQRNNGYNTKVTTVLFDHGYEMLYKRKDISEVKELTTDEYYVRGSTSLLDAIGRTITTLNKEISNKVLFVITTDGYENSSIEYTKQQIKNLIENQKWEFIYIGADIDSFAEASSIGIRKSNTANYKKTENGLNNLFCSVGEASDILSEKDSLDVSWKSKLEE